MSKSTESAKPAKPHPDFPTMSWCSKYRLISAIHYNRGIVYVRHVLTHAHYDVGTWKEECQ